MQRVLLFLFGLVLAVAPLPLASNRDWSWSPLALSVAVLLLLCGLEIARNGDAYRRTLANAPSLLVPFALMAIVIAWALMQTSDWTPASWASPFSAAGVLGGSTGIRSVALNHEAVFIGVMRLLLNAGAFLIGAVLASSVPNARRLLGTIVIVATVTTLYAMIAQVVNGQAPKTGISIWTPHDGFFSGTFVNSGNYATYAGVAAIAALSLALRPRRDHTPESLRQRWRRRLSTISGSAGFWLANALVLMMGVLFSESKAGLLSLVLCLTIMAVLYSRGGRRIVWLVVIPLTIAVLALLLPGGRSTVSRMMALAAEGDDSRLQLYAIALDAIGRRPWTGWGLNSFQGLFPIFQPVDMPQAYDKVHNTYLELAFDLGLPVAMALLAAILWIVRQCVVGFFQRGRDAELPGAGMLAAVLVGFHALFDFGIQIPAMAVTFFAILGIGWTQSWPTGGRRS